MNNKLTHVIGIPDFLNFKYSLQDISNLVPHFEQYTPSRYSCKIWASVICISISCMLRNNCNLLSFDLVDHS